MVDDDFMLNSFEPSYIAIGHGELARRRHVALQQLESCGVCPRQCRVDRLHNETGQCRTGRMARVVSAFPHMGEEDCLRGWAGSGTIFLALCNLHCVFCQNFDTSQQMAGQELDGAELAGLMLQLQARGCHNINFVTPEHVVPQVLEAIVEAAASGLRLPIVYNTSAYDSVESLRLLEGIVDIYMPDFKFWEPATAARLSDAADYPQRARDAIGEMHRQVGPLKFTANSLACRGLLVRHLVMPGQLDETAEIMRWLAELCPDTFVNLMGQYRPAHRVGMRGADGKPTFSEIDRCPTFDELQQAYQLARQAGLWRFDKPQPR